MINKSIFDDLCNTEVFKQQILQVRMFMRMSDEEFNCFSNQISSIAKNAPIYAPEMAQIVQAGAMLGFQLSELSDFLKFTVNMMFALNEKIEMASHWTGLLTNASNETWEFDQDIVDSTDSVLRSIVYLTNVINGNIIFVK